MLDDLGLVAALRGYLDQQAQRVGYRGQLAAEPAEIRLGLTAATAVFRVAQEALTNIARHARARRVRVSLRLCDGALRLDVRDDGVGFDPEATFRRGSGSRGLGLGGMGERASPGSAARSPSALRRVRGPRSGSTSPPQGRPRRSLAWNRFAS